jgi:hypothetical protein
MNCGLNASKSIVVGISTQGYRCIPVVSNEGVWIGIVLSTSLDQTAIPNQEMTFTVRYISY